MKTMIHGAAAVRLATRFFLATLAMGLAATLVGCTDNQPPPGVYTYSQVGEAKAKAKSENRNIAYVYVGRRPLFGKQKSANDKGIKEARANGVAVMITRNDWNSLSPEIRGALGGSIDSQPIPRGAVFNSDGTMHEAYFAYSYDQKVLDNYERQQMSAPGVTAPSGQPQTGSMDAAKDYQAEMQRRQQEEFRKKNPVVDTSKFRMPNPDTNKKTTPPSKFEQDIHNWKDERSRLWTDYKGRTIQGTLQSFDGGSVTILTKEGKTVNVKLQKLSSRDQQYIRGR